MMVSGLAKDLASQDGLIWLAIILCISCYISATQESIQHCNLMFIDNLHFEALVHCSTPHPSPLQELIILLRSFNSSEFYLILQETLQAATSTGSGLKNIILRVISCAY